MLKCTGDTFTVILVNKKLNSCSWLSYGLVCRASLLLIVRTANERNTTDGLYIAYFYQEKTFNQSFIFECGGNQLNLHIFTVYLITLMLAIRFHSLTDSQFYCVISFGSPMTVKTPRQTLVLVAQTIWNDVEWFLWNELLCKRPNDWNNEIINKKLDDWKYECSHWSSEAKPNQTSHVFNSHLYI